MIKILNKAAKVNKTHFSEKSVEDIPPTPKEGRVWQLFSSRIMTIRTLILYFNWYAFSLHNTVFPNKIVELNFQFYDILSVPVYYVPLPEIFFEII